MYRRDFILDETPYFVDEMTRIRKVDPNTSFGKVTHVPGDILFFI